MTKIKFAAISLLLTLSLVTSLEACQQPANRDSENKSDFPTQIGRDNENSPNHTKDKENDKNDSNSSTEDKEDAGTSSPSPAQSP